ncbi:MAG: hypothetical protein JO000_17435 [Alphaproteobacteria bacterium]|nr:hypothetical protein [Alphaproteobacteria bacterium]
MIVHEAARKPSDRRLWHNHYAIRKVRDADRARIENTRSGDRAIFVTRVIFMAQPPDTSEKHVAAANVRRSFS